MSSGVNVFIKSFSNILLSQRNHRKLSELFWGASEMNGLIGGAAAFPGVLRGESFCMVESEREREPAPATRRVWKPPL